MIHGLLSSVVCVLLVFSLGQSQQQEPPAKAKTVPSAPKTDEKKEPQRKRVISDLRGFDLLEPSKQPMVVGATRGFPKPVPLAPRLGKVFGLNPTFAWSYEGKGRRFIFTLLDDAQDELSRAEVNDIRFRYPSEAPRVEPGKTYFWTVEAAGVILGGGPAPLVGFIVVSVEQRAEIEKRLAQITTTDPYEAQLARARVFTEHRLWYDAIAAYTDLIARFPDRAELYEHRGMLYAQLEVTKALAEQDFARADNFQKKSDPR